VNDLAARIDDIDAVGPARVGPLDLVIDRIDENRDGKTDLLGELLGYFLPLGQRFGVSYLELSRRLSRPADRMRLANINDVNVGLVLVRLIKLLDRTDRAEERRSRAASKQEHDRLPF